ncbi:MAG: hypothetical protein ACSHWQ_10100, partial [Spongiibacteraceae bacterium]
MKQRNWLSTFKKLKVCALTGTALDQALYRHPDKHFRRRLSVSRYRVKTKGEGGPLQVFALL